MSSRLTIIIKSSKAQIVMIESTESTSCRRQPAVLAGAAIGHGQIFCNGHGSRSESGRRATFPSCDLRPHSESEIMKAVFLSNLRFRRVWCQSAARCAKGLAGRPGQKSLRAERLLCARSEAAGQAARFWSLEDAANDEPTLSHVHDRLRRRGSFGAGAAACAGNAASISLANWFTLCCRAARERGSREWSAENMDRQREKNVGQSFPARRGYKLQTFSRPSSICCAV